jgi:hypothetical protein
LSSYSFSLPRLIEAFTNRFSLEERCSVAYTQSNPIPNVPGILVLDLASDEERMFVKTPI